MRNVSVQTTTKKCPYFTAYLHKQCDDDFLTRKKSFLSLFWKISPFCCGRAYTHLNGKIAELGTMGWEHELYIACGLYNMHQLGSSPFIYSFYAAISSSTPWRRAIIKLHRRQVRLPCQHHSPCYPSCDHFISARRPILFINLFPVIRAWVLHLPRITSISSFEFRFLHFVHFKP